MLKNAIVSDKTSKQTDHGLPQATLSICPECLTPLPATLFERQGKVWMEKHCEKHGEYTEIISSDVRFFEKMDRLEQASESAVHQPITSSTENCPRDCGLCEKHLSAPMMVVIDITNRCNLRCPICFANAAVSGQVHELSVEQVREMLRQTFTVSEIAPPCLQFSGGEPTIHPDFFEMIRVAKAAGYAQIQLGTNGLRFADDAAFALAAADAGLNVVYLQFDGLTDDIYMKTRGRPLADKKQQAIDNIRKAGMEICLVPTLARGVNDHQLGDIFRFAVDHSDCVIGISWQPVAFTGRIDLNQRMAMRFTLTDLARELEKQTDGQVQMFRDWFPLASASAFSRLVTAITAEPTPSLSCHRRCGIGNYILVDPATKNVFPLSAFVDIEGLFSRMQKIADTLQKRKWLKHLTLMLAMKNIERFLNVSALPPDWQTKDFFDFLNSFANFRQLYPNNESRIQYLKNSRYRSLLMLGMHFQDVYNYELPRTQRCVVQYIAADGRMYPFCTYNSGPCHRTRVEKQFSHPVRNVSFLTPEKPKYECTVP
jgi:uncharacterized radical SAM superfamily Fe-S cluster-containing enzyme